MKQQKMFDELKQSELNLRSMLENAQGYAIYRLAVDPDNPYLGQVVLVSPSIRDVVGIEDPYDFKSWFDGIHPDDEARIVAANQRAIKEGTRFDEEMRFYNKRQKAWRWVQTVSNPVFDQNGRLTHFNGITIDITRQKEAEATLSHLNLILEEKVELRTQELDRLYHAEQERRVDLEQRHRVAESLRTILAMLNSGHPLQEILETISRQASELMGGETAVAIFQYAATDERFELRASHQLPQILRETKSVPVAIIGGKAFKQQKPLLVPDVAQYVDRIRPLVSPEEPEVLRALDAFRAHFQSYMAVPLVMRDTIYGGIAFHFTTKRTLNEEEVTLALTLSNQAALAIENARLYEIEHRRREESERRRQVAEGLRDILARLNSDQALPELLDAIVAQADMLLDSDVVALYLLKEETQVLKIQALRGTLDPLIREVVLPLGVGTIGRVVAEQRPMIIPDVSQLPIFTSREAAGREDTAVFIDEERQTALGAAIHQFQAVLGLPLVAQGVAYGGLAFYYHQPCEFSEEEINLAMTFAGQAALAIQNARLRDNVEQVAVLAERNRLARELHDAVTQTLFSASLIADVLPRIWQRSPETGEARLAELRELTRGALAEMRTLLLELRPATLTESSLDELLRQLAAAVIGRSRIQVAVEVEGERERPLPPDTQVALYRIAQESLNNVVKHAGAERVNVTLRFLPECVELTIADNGRGFDATSVGITSLGLGIMHERTAKIGAKLHVESLIGEGTTVRVQVCA